MKKFYIIILLLIVLIITINFSSGIKNKVTSGMYTLTQASSQAFSNFGRSIRKKFSFIFNISNLKKQNATLSAKLLELEVDKSRILELEKENSLLQKELGFLDQSEKGTLVPAKIIDREPTTFLDYMIVDKGSDDGIVTGSAVVFNGVLVGQIKDVYQNSAKIILITSKDSLVQSMLQDCRAKGILKGGINGLYMENIISDTEFKTGENIVTSGLGGKIRAGILIGQAGKIQSSSSGIFKTIAVEPAIDLSTLELVFIEKK